MSVNKHLIDSLLSKAPASVFCESASGTPGQGASTRARGNRCKTPSTNPLYTEGALSSIKHKNYMIKSKSSVELQTLINHSLNEEKKNKRDLVSDL